MCAMSGISIFCYVTLWNVIDINGMMIQLNRSQQTGSSVIHHLPTKWEISKSHFSLMTTCVGKTREKSKDKFLCNVWTRPQLKRDIVIASQPNRTIDITISGATCACYKILHNWLSIGWWDGFFQAAGVVVVDDNDVDDDDNVRSEGGWFNAVTIWC